MKEIRRIFVMSLATVVCVAFFLAFLLAVIWNF